MFQHPGHSRGRTLSHYRVKWTTIPHIRGSTFSLAQGLWDYPKDPELSTRGWLPGMFLSFYFSTGTELYEAKFCISQDSMLLACVINLNTLPSRAREGFCPGYRLPRPPQTLMHIHMSSVDTCGPLSPSEPSSPSGPGMPGFPCDEKEPTC